MHKTDIFDQKNNVKNLTYLSYFFPDRYRKQTISFFRSKGVFGNFGHEWVNVKVFYQAHNFTLVVYQS